MDVTHRLNFRENCQNLALIKMGFFPYLGVIQGTVLNMTQYVSMNFHGSIGKFSSHFSCTIFGGLANFDA